MSFYLDSLRSGNFSECITRYGWIHFNNIPLADIDYKILEPKCEFDLFELHTWLKDIFVDQSDEICI